MNLEILLEQLKGVLPDVEQYLTSVTYEEGKVEITTSDRVSTELLVEGAVKSDVYLYARDVANETDIVVFMDEEWFGLLSSIMLGVEEKKLNEVTRDLLLKFGTELSELLVAKLKAGGLQVRPENMQVLTLAQLTKELQHTEYFTFTLNVSGLADDVVRAGFIVADPAAVPVVEPKPEPEVSEPVGTDEADVPMNGKSNGSPTNGKAEEVITGQRVEFADFGEATAIFEELDGTNIDLLKDVNMDVSVELGQIEMSLGKVLQLTKGSVLELDKLAGEPVDILVNGHRIAQGEVVVIDEHFGVRISNLVSTRERLARMN
jgi:flagellar motor switch protein FliN